MANISNQKLEGIPRDDNFGQSVLPLSKRVIIKFKINYTRRGLRGRQPL